MVTTDSDLPFFFPLISVSVGKSDSFDGRMTFSSLSLADMEDLDDGVDVVEDDVNCG